MLGALASGEDISIPGPSCEQELADAGFPLTEQGISQALREGMRTNDNLLVLYATLCARSHGYPSVPKLMRELIDAYEFAGRIGNEKLSFIAKYLEFGEVLDADTLTGYYILAKENMFALDPSLQLGAYRVLFVLHTAYNLNVCAEYVEIAMRPRAIVDMAYFRIYIMLRKHCSEQMSQSDFESIYLAWKNETGEKFERFLGYLEEWASEDPRFEIPQEECPE
jgi:hypothetical protein